MKVFIAGIMQGSRNDKKIFTQNYRTRIIEMIRQKYGQDIEFIDPDATDPDRLSYNTSQAKKMFIKYCHIAGIVDLLISYIPKASMGSAIEMWSAYSNNVPIVTISPLEHNWVVKSLSNEIFSSITEFKRQIKLGTTDKYVVEKQKG